MTDVVDNTVTPSLDAEWNRLELLAQSLSAARQGREAPGSLLDRLRRVQAEVTASRRAGSWSSVVGEDLLPLELDVLACIAGPEAQPRLGWLYQSLQPGAALPYATLALMQELLALDGPSDAMSLREIAGEGGVLRRLRLVELQGESPFDAVRPSAKLVARLTGRSIGDAPPPGAVRVCSDATWDNLVLAPDRIEMLKEFLYWVRHRGTVVGTWGGPDIGGPLALFTGPSGTGKTLAASVIANELGWPLFRVDLGKLVSKFIGETEKNINSLFEAAHDRDVVLQFDEADSIFGKRGEIKEARDRYANMEVSHLLSRVESHRGPCVLTTNLRGNLDSAFARRFQAVVEFPRPDPPMRVELWRRHLPPHAPGVAALDIELIGRSAPLTGGGIRNAALHAAYLAAAESTSLAMPHVALAVWRELGKEGKETSRSDLGDLAAHLDARRPKEAR